MGERADRSSVRPTLLQRRSAMHVRRVFFDFLAAGILVLAASTYGEAQAPSTLLIRGATIIDGLADAPIRDRALLIEGNIIDGVSVKTIFRDPRHIEFDLPAPAIERATPNPYFAPGPAQNTGIIGYRAVAIHVFNPPPEGGISNTVQQMVLPN